MLSYAWSDNTPLRCIPEERLRRLARTLLLQRYARGEVIHSADEPLQQIIFPLQGAISLRCSPESGKRVEVGVVGNEGFVGMPVLLGGETALLHAVAHQETPALTMDRQTFRELLDRFSPFASICRRYAQALLIMLAQGSVCHGTHLIDQRCARWILTMHDRAGTGSLLLTRDTFSRAIGVRRASVGSAIRRLEAQGVIAFHRGCLTIIDGQRLEKFSCPCYRAVKVEFDRLIPEHLSQT